MNWLACIAGIAKQLHTQACTAAPVVASHAQVQSNPDGMLGKHSKHNQCKQPNKCKQSFKVLHSRKPSTYKCNHTLDRKAMSGVQWQPSQACMATCLAVGDPQTTCTTFRRRLNPPKVQHPKHGFLHAFICPKENWQRYKMGRQSLRRLGSCVLCMG